MEITPDATRLINVVNDNIRIPKSATVVQYDQGFVVGSPKSAVVDNGTENPVGHQQCFVETADNNQDPDSAESIAATDTNQQQIYYGDSPEQAECKTIKIHNLIL